MLNELDKTLARMGAYIMALEQTLAKVQEQLRVLTEDRENLIAEIAAGKLPKVVTKDGKK